MRTRSKGKGCVVAHYTPSLASTIPRWRIMGSIPQAGWPSPGRDQARARLITGSARPCGASFDAARGSVQASRRVRTRILTGVLGASLACSADAADWGGTLGWSSDNILHGRSLSGGEPAWFGGVHREGERWAASAQATATHPDRTSRDVQLGLQVERRWRFGEAWSAQLGLIRYESPFDDHASERRYNEATARAGFRGRAWLSLSHSPDLPAFDVGSGWLRGKATYVEASLRQPLGHRVAIEIGVGHADLRAFETQRPPAVPFHDYRYASASLRFRLGDVYAYATWVHANRPAPAYFAGESGPRKLWAGAVVWSF